MQETRVTDVPLDKVKSDSIANHKFNQNRTQLLITVGNCQNCASAALQGTFNSETTSSDIAKKIISVRDKLVEDMVEKYGVGK